jgi:DNA primase
VCIFGTKSVNKDNIVDHLTPYLLAGVEKVFIMFDGDDAGRAATKHVQSCIEHKTDLIVETIDLPDGIDPSTLSDEMLKELQNMLQNHRN